MAFFAATEGRVKIWLAFALTFAAIVGAFAGTMIGTAIDVYTLNKTVVGKTPEGFHRLDAQELMEAICLMNEGLRCPDPYRLPNYQQQMLAARK